MINKIKNLFNDLDDITYKIMNKGIKSSLFITLTSTLILLIYQMYSFSPFLYHLGITIFKTSIYFLIEFIICGIIVDNIKKETI